MEAAQKLADKVTDIVINPILLLFFAVGLLFFVFGVVEFMWGLNNETDMRERGKQHMFWGVVGMFIMSAAYSIVLFIQSLFPAPPSFP
ncbi:hypothetical protein H7X87_04205 [Acetobacteraceae bacterium]|nr:hypothetical protein [Candidatus Parcubacteria bacterium]